ncbi:MAG: 1-acyl-sn-glycerol-3-phosphate acyltransferase [Proteobacteria bacterium]|nr:1-acyl-sn-glycerol-3-phosphate acyltransferase [Pseudomonadota bacterium]
MNDTGLYDPAPRAVVIHDLVDRSRRRLDGMPDGALTPVLEDALYQERKRLADHGGSHEEHILLDDLARTLVRGDRYLRIEAALRLVAHWADEVHGHFDNRMYRFSTHLLPRAVNGLLAGRPKRMRDIRGGWDRRLRVEGDTSLLQQLSREATLILAPTHVSNLDSPLIGLALYQAGLPPFVYGAGLNLFKNPVMGFFMSRLGAYTVDRTKRASLYKEVLKDYSVRSLTTRHHSLFFPGGTRSRSGEIESNLKKGLLGTGITAWQEMLAAKRKDSEVYVVPLTLSFQLTLEADTLATDHLAEAGKQRFIITDDEFAKPKEVLAFGRRVLDLEASCIAHFGEPLDCLGNPVSKDSAVRRDQAEHRRNYVCDRDGNVIVDAQRDRVYTDRLATALAQAYPRGSYVMETHLVAWVAWRCLTRQIGSDDPFRVIRVPRLGRIVRDNDFHSTLRAAMDELAALAEKGSCQLAIPNDPDRVLATALDRFGRYHRTRAVAREGRDLIVEDPKLALYYRNRLAWASLEA